MIYNELGIFYDFVSQAHTQASQKTSAKTCVDLINLVNHGKTVHFQKNTYSNRGRICFEALLKAL